MTKAACYRINPFCAGLEGLRYNPYDCGHAAEGLMGSRVYQPDKSAGGLISAMRYTNAEREAIREQTERVLASPLFRNSKRYTSLLRFAVDQRLSGNLDCLKERSLGIEVFGREPDYNTTNDPVVRTSAVEVRKRLAEYYQQPGHEREIRIELPQGCYVPEFRNAEPSAGSPESDPRALEPPVRVEPLPEWLSPAPKAKSPIPKSNWRWRVFASTAGVLLIAALWWKPWQPADVLDQFWRPVCQASSPVLFSVTGLPGALPAAAAGTGEAQSVGDILRSGRDAVPLPDVTAVVDIASYLKSKGKTYRIRMSRDIQFQDLRSGPVVVIGPVTRWQVLLGAGWRFNITRDEAITATWISDRDNPQSRDWLVRLNAPANSTADVYALVTRTWNETIGQMTVLIAGLSTYATTAAGELLSDRREIQQLAALAPRGWERKNIQLVVAAKRVGTSAGTPRMVAVHTW